MTRYHLAKLVNWAGMLKSRKRLQKVVFLLQAGGCPLGADFFLHHYGPYSEDVARLTDEMVRENLLIETSEGQPGFERYNYRLSDETSRQLSALDGSAQGEKLKAELAAFEAKARSFLAAELKELEYAATIVYFKQQGYDWPVAVEKATTFKNDEAVKNALRFAQQAVS
jgi:uncharacterized protein